MIKTFKCYKLGPNYIYTGVDFDIKKKSKEENYKGLKKAEYIHISAYDTTKHKEYIDEIEKAIERVGVYVFQDKLEFYESIIIGKKFEKLDTESN